MIKFKDFDENKITEYSLENLKSFVNEIEMKKSVILEDCASVIGELLKKQNIDMYSRGGQRKLKKATKKYTDMLMGADDFLRIINDEITKKEQYEEEMRYSGKSVKSHNNISTEEFLQKEQDKIMADRSKIE